MKKRFKTVIFGLAAALLVPTSALASTGWDPIGSPYSSELWSDGL